MTPRTELASSFLLTLTNAVRPSLRSRSHLLPGLWRPNTSPRISSRPRKRDRSYFAKSKLDKFATALDFSDDGPFPLRDEVTLYALRNLGIRHPHYMFRALLGRLVGIPKTRSSIEKLAGTFHDDLRSHWRRVALGSKSEELEAIGKDLPLLRDPAILSEALYIAGHRLWNAKDLDDPVEDASFLNLARYLLEISLEMGNRKAALDLTIIATIFPDTVLLPAALREVRTAAVERTDSRAMAVYVRYLLDREKDQTMETRELAFALAERLSTLYEPASPHRVITLTTDPIYRWESPWALLRDAALQRLQLDYPSPEDPKHREINDALVAALRQGVNQYNDPEACRQLGDHPSINEFSPEWMELKTKSAVDGHSDSCFNIARYYIEYWGWYPCVGKMPSTRSEAIIGLRWLALSAEGHLHDAQIMSYRHQLLALLMRENGMSKAGHIVIKSGIHAIENYSTDTRAKAWAKRELESFDRNWDIPFPHRVHLLLGDQAKPKLSPEQRHQESSSSGWRHWLGIK